MPKNILKNILRIHPLMKKKGMKMALKLCIIGTKSLLRGDNVFAILP